MLLLMSSYPTKSYSHKPLMISSLNCNWDHKSLGVRCQSGSQVLKVHQLKCWFLKICILARTLIVCGIMLCTAWQHRRNKLECLYLQKFQNLSPHEEVILCQECKCTTINTSVHSLSWLSVFFFLFLFFLEEKQKQQQKYTGWLPCSTDNSEWLVNQCTLNSLKFSVMNGMKVYWIYHS